jgi:hypothetical protein
VPSCSVKIYRNGIATHGLGSGRRRSAVLCLTGRLPGLRHPHPHRSVEAAISAALLLVLAPVRPVGPQHPIHPTRTILLPGPGGPPHGALIHCMHPPPPPPPRVAAASSAAGGSWAGPPRLYFGPTAPALITAVRGPRPTHTGNEGGPAARDGGVKRPRTDFADMDGGRGGPGPPASFWSGMPGASGGQRCEGSAAAGGGRLWEGAAAAGGGGLWVASAAQRFAPRPRLL